jgi:hypothetical protein
LQRLKRIEEALKNHPIEPIKRRIFILERNFFASAKRKTKLNSTLTSLESEVRGQLSSLNTSLINLSEQLEANQGSNDDLSPVLRVQLSHSETPGGFKVMEKNSTKNDDIPTFEQILHTNSALVDTMLDQLLVLSTIVQRQTEQIDAILFNTNTTKFSKLLVHNRRVY